MFFFNMLIIRLLSGTRPNSRLKAYGDDYFCLWSVMARLTLS